MHLGICIGMDRLATLGKRLKAASAEGFVSCQLISWSPEMWTPANAALVAQAVREAGIRVSGFWCGWEGPRVWNFHDGPQTLGLVPEAYRQTRVGNLCDGADFARRLGIKNVITHMGFLPENPGDRAFIPLCLAVRTVAGHLRASGQKLLFETGQETPVAMLRCFETVGEENLGVNLDTGNLIMYGKANPVDALDVLGRFVMDVHAKDAFYPTDGHDLGREVPIGQGRVDFPTLLRRLRDLGYQGPLTIEREISGREQLRDIRQAKAYLSGLLEQMDREAGA